MPERDFKALDSYQLVPRVLHEVHEVDAQCQVLGRSLAAPIMPLLDAMPVVIDRSLLTVLSAAHVLDEERGAASAFLPMLQPAKMGELMPLIRKLAARDVPAIVLDFRPLAATSPFGSNIWKPKTREDLAELRAAAGCPLWLHGISHPRDAEIAMEAGLEAIIVNAETGQFLDSPATIEVFPEVFDAVAGMMDVYAGGSVRHGMDIFRYLAVGAEAVIAQTDRSFSNLKAELEYAMRLTGCATLADISYDAIFAPLFGDL